MEFRELVRGISQNLPRKTVGFIYLLVVKTVSFTVVQMMWVERTILTTSFPLPGILRWFPVTAIETVIHSSFVDFLNLLFVQK